MTGNYISDFMKKKWFLVPRTSEEMAKYLGEEGCPLVEEETVMAKMIARENRPNADRFRYVRDGEKVLTPIANCPDVIQDIERKNFVDRLAKIYKLQGNIDTILNQYEEYVGWCKKNNNMLPKTLSQWASGKFADHIFSMLQELDGAARDLLNDDN